MYRQPLANEFSRCAIAVDHSHTLFPFLALTSPTKSLKFSCRDPVSCGRPCSCEVRRTLLASSRWHRHTTLCTGRRSCELHESQNFLYIDVIVAPNCLMI